MVANSVGVMFVILSVFPSIINISNSCLALSHFRVLPNGFGVCEGALEGCNLGERSESHTPCYLLSQFYFVHGKPAHHFL